MLAYMICFPTSCCLFWFAEQNRQHKCSYWAICFIALLFPAALSGLRDLTVGIDVVQYAYPVFNDARTSPSPYSMYSRWDGWISQSYLTLNFIASRIFPNIHFLFFFISFAECVLVFLTIRQWRDKIPVWLGMFCFYCFLFTYSLNAIRQSLAMSIAFFATPFLFKRKCIHFCITILIASLFHKTALALLAYYPLYVYLIHFKSTKSKILVFVSIFIAFLFAKFLIDTYLPMFAKYAEYMSTKEENLRTPYKAFIYLSIPLILFYINREKLFKLQECHFGIMMLIFIVLVQLTPMLGGNELLRISDFFTWYLPLFLPLVFIYFYESYPKSVVNFCAIFYCSFYCYFMVIKAGRGGVYPWTSQILNSIF